MGRVRGGRVCERDGIEHDTTILSSLYGAEDGHFSNVYILLCMCNI